MSKRREAAARRIQDAAGKIQAVAKGWYVRKKVQEQRDRQDMEQRFHGLMDRHREKMRILEEEKRELLKLPGGELEDWERRRFLAAVRVQAAWRGLVARRRLARSPERAKREQAARRIQAAFKKVMRSRSAGGAFAGVLSAAGSLALQPGGRGAGTGPSPSRQSYALRQSGASVLLGSPRLPDSPSGGGGALSPPAARSPLSALSPQQQAQQAQAGRSGVAGAGLGPGGEIARSAATMGTKRYKELQAQVEGKLGAYVALAKARGSARRPDGRAIDARLAALLGEHRRTAPERLAAARTRQQNLVAVDGLCAQLEQVRPLADLPPDAAPQDFPRPPRGSERAERAATAHALALAEARVGTRWWAHLRGLNTTAVQDALLAEDEERWDAMDAVWRRRWQEAEEEENRRPELLDQLKPRTGAGAAAVAAARQAVAMRSKEDEYAARAAAAALAVPVAPMAGAAAARVG
ncbi:hypothetical protein GPECTOR_44g69 [Gonium pectorale]|uniref:Uncharacterized protein n=1 Tax=Gonium pectorale TaxID=33097 RepID=A0A150G9F2_GONPE|nr:hypothetical protein GPECTOR_44g69 [Gonium pectorale]|eukprot:KXZ46393.1 hypothetical protein GPECTOR_44g69 [Gonium pectorale]